MTKFGFLLKKEAKDFLYSYKCWGVCIILAFLQKIFSLGDIEIDFYFYFWFVTVGISQYMYDSYLTDVKEKGFLFLNNLGITFKEYFAAKILFALILGALLVIMRIDLFFKVLKIYDLIWVLLLVVFAFFAIFLFAVLTNNSEMGGVALAAFLCLGIIFCVYKMKYFILRTLFLAAMDALLCFISSKAYKSLYFRKQI